MNMTYHYDDVLKEAGEAPPYVSKKDFTTVWGYAGGKVLGSFPDREAAIKAGAITTDKTTDEEKYSAAQEVYRKFHADVQTEWMKRMRADHPEVNDAVFDIAYSEAYDRGHSAGYTEVENYIGDYVSLAVRFIEAASK
jgi:hypothetical protein